MADVNATYPPSRTMVPDDAYSTRRQELDSPASYAFQITPSQADLPTTIRGLYIGTSGNVFCRISGGNTTHNSANVFFENVIGGTVLPVRLKGVYDYNLAGHPGQSAATPAGSAQNTTSTGLVGLY